MGPLNTPVLGNGASEQSLMDHFTPMTAEDVGEKISKIRKKAAAGPGGLQKELLLIPGLPAILAKMYDICWYSSYFPAIWKENRTTLISKFNKTSSLVENWRPVTIGPILGRIFSSILDRKIRKSFVLSLRQKGFTSKSGCKINIDLLSAALDYSKWNNGEIFTIVDISKAFDTIPHSVLKPCLERKGVSPPIIHFITKIYKDVKTTIRTKDNIGVEVKTPEV